MSVPDPREALLAKVAALKASLRSEPLHQYGGLEDTPDGVRFRCRRCGLIDAATWAAPCEPKETSA